MPKKDNNSIKSDAQKKRAILSRREIINLLSTESQLSLDTCQYVVKLVTEIMKRGIIAGKSVQFSNFMTLEAFRREKKRVVTPSGESLLVPSYSTMRCRVSPKFKYIMNQKNPDKD